LNYSRDNRQYLFLHFILKGGWQHIGEQLFKNTGSKNSINGTIIKIATASQPATDSPKENNGDQTLKQKKTEASPEECDQAVEGLSTVKAKAKQAQESRKKDETIVRKFWSLFMGIGPALRAIASMSRLGQEASSMER